MKIIEIGNCLPNKEPGIIISATKDELANLYSGLLYKDVVILSKNARRKITTLDRIRGADTLRNLLKDSWSKSFTMNDINYFLEKAIAQFEKEEENDENQIKELHFTATEEEYHEDD